ncbi:MAG TPA: DUF2017 domain-containing protein [Streptosporangiaceae bacterium]|nr:DUF2017 domain-containing protein [Streptosporangiaceae bacterium]
MAGFRRTANGATARFAAGEAAIIRSLVSQVAELVGGEASSAMPGAAPGPAAAGQPPAGQPQPGEPAGAAGPGGLDDLAAQLGLSDSAELPADPILARLLPDGYADDPDASKEFRRYTEIGLRSAKVEVAQTVLATLPPGGGTVRLSVQDGQAWLRALNDVRLSLGVVLGVTDDFDEQVADMSADDPQAAYVGVYQWLAAVQDSLVDALS